MLSRSHPGDTVPLPSPSCAGNVFYCKTFGGSSCLGSSPNSVRCDFDLQELLTDLIIPENIALFAASLAARSPPSPSAELVSPGLEHVTSSPLLTVSRLCSSTTLMPLATKTSQCLTRKPSKQ